MHMQLVSNIKKCWGSNVSTVLRRQSVDTIPSEASIAAKIAAKIVPHSNRDSVIYKEWQSVDHVRATGCLR